MSNGTYVVWEGRGRIGGKSTETGYVFSGGQLVAVSHSEFERTGDAHFVLRNWDAPTDDGPGALSSIQDCSRRSG
jgi:hypothetical protein